MPDPHATTATTVTSGRVEWRVIYDHGGWNTFNTDPAIDAGRALAAFNEERANGHDPTLLLRTGAGEWRTVTIDPVCPECDGTRRTVQGGTAKSGAPGDQHGPCATCHTIPADDDLEWAAGMYPATSDVRTWAAHLVAEVEKRTGPRLVDAWERGHFYCAAEQDTDARCRNPYSSLTPSPAPAPAPATGEQAGQGQAGEPAAEPSYLEMVGFNKPATLEQALDFLEDLAVSVLEHVSCPAWCADCETWELPGTCPTCKGSGCLPNAALAYLECGQCAGAGRAHPGSSDAARARIQTLAEVANLLQSEIFQRPEPGSQSAADHGAVRALADVKALIEAPEFTYPPADVDQALASGEDGSR